MAKPSRVPRIYVLAGANGGGKSSLMGAMLLQQGVEYFNPDHAAQRILSANPGISPLEANSAAWHEGKRLLERAITEKLDFAFETTLGGETIASLLEKALSRGIEVRIWYLGLDSVERHIARVRSRVAQGGHDIPEEKIRERHTQSRLDLIRLLPRLTELLLYDNSKEADPHTGIAPEPTLVLRLVQGKVREMCDLTGVPAWAKPILATALKLNLTNEVPFQKCRMTKEDTGAHTGLSRGKDSSVNLCVLCGSTGSYSTDHADAKHPGTINAHHGARYPKMRRTSC